MSKRGIIVLLAGVNLLLAAVLIARAAPLPGALAQAGGGRPGEFISVTGKASGEAYEVHYLLDTRQRRLHAFFIQNPTARKLGYAGSRNLEDDFK